MTLSTALLVCYPAALMAFLAFCLFWPVDD
jgi:hypothetical protein